MAVSRVAVHTHGRHLLRPLILSLTAALCVLTRPHLYSLISHSKRNIVTWKLFLVEYLTLSISVLKSLGVTRSHLESLGVNWSHFKATCEYGAVSVFSSSFFSSRDKPEMKI